MNVALHAHAEAEGGKPKYSRGSLPTWKAPGVCDGFFALSLFTSYRPAQAHNLLGHSVLLIPSEGVCSGIAMAGGRFRHELCILDLVSVIIAAGRRAGHVSIRSWRRDQRDWVQLITYPMLVPNPCWYGEGRTGARRGGVWIPVTRRVLNIDRYWHRYRHRHRCLEMVGGNIATGARALGKMAMEDGVDDLTSGGACVADWRRCSTATATP